MYFKGFGKVLVPNYLMLQKYIFTKAATGGALL